ncbi:MAG: PilZ domain-containing protein [Actinomycetota bacterium]|nr:PilZ domain-containing protein [Actinomycetota bacterium]
MNAPEEGPYNQNPSAFGHPLAVGELLAIRFREPLPSPTRPAGTDLPLSASAVVVGAMPDSVVVRLALPLAPDDVAGRGATAVLAQGSGSLVAQVRAVPITIAGERLLELRVQSGWQRADRRESLRIKCGMRARVAPEGAPPELAFISQAIDISHLGIAVASTPEMGAHFSTHEGARCWLELLGATLELSCRVASVGPDRIGLAFQRPDAHAQRIIGAYLFRLQVQERTHEEEE